MKKYLLVSVFAFFLCASSPAQVLLTESFSGGSLPAGWSNDSLGFPAIHLWIFDNIYQRNISGSDFDANFAIFDSDEGDFDDGFDEDAALTTPIIDLSTASVSLYLEFDEQFNNAPIFDPGYRIIEISIDSGMSWSLLDSTVDGIGFPNPAVRTSYDISSVLGASSLMVRFHWRGSWDWWWAIDNVTIISRQPCTPPANAGAAISNMNIVCPDLEFYLSLTGADQALGLTYQWQYSPDDNNWFDLLDDTMNFAYASQISSTYYRCVVTCSGIPSYSTSVLIDMDVPLNCYCIGEFADDCDAIDKIIFNTLSNIGTGCNGNTNSYILYPMSGNTTTTVYADSTYDFTFASGDGSGNHGAAIWFDFNQDGDFQDMDEFYFISDSIPENSADIITAITIPSGISGDIRMRVRYVLDNTMNTSSDCDPYGNGETEDYIITILDAAVGIKEVAEQNVSVFPIPATSYLRIDVGSKNANVYVNLLDGMGRICLSQTLSEGSVDLDVSRMSRGIYFLRVVSNVGSVMRKVVLE